MTKITAAQKNAFAKMITNFESKEIFQSVHSYNEVHDGYGMLFSDIEDGKDGGKFIPSKWNDDYGYIPCGPSVTDEHSVSDCSFGICDDGTMVAFIEGVRKERNFA